VVAYFNSDWNSLFLQSFLWKFETVTYPFVDIASCGNFRHNGLKAHFFAELCIH
jgi:hypothetical protein